jgi:flagellar protein FliO/FliZ
MTSSYVSVVIFLLLVACVPLALRWFKKQGDGWANEAGGQSKIISAVAVGPHQRVVTVEVGAQGERVRLTLGVTTQAISMLHSAPVAAGGQPVVSAQPVVSVAGR